MVRRTVGSLALGILVLAGLVAGPVAESSAEPEFRNKRPPVISSATVDAQRRLAVTFTAPDGVLYGGHVYMGNSTTNLGAPSGDPSYGQFMFCNNKGTCQGRWALEQPSTAATGPFTFTSPPLDVATFGAGTWQVQVETTNEDTFASTRQWENSNIVSVELPAGKPGAGGGAAGGAGSTPKFGGFSVGTYQNGGQLPGFHVGVACGAAKYFSVHVEFTTLSGKTFFGKAVARGETKEVPGVVQNGNANFELRGRVPKEGFVIKVSNVACWSDDQANAIGPGRKVFTRQCRSFAAGCLLTDTSGRRLATRASTTPGADPHPVPTTLAPIPDVGDASDADADEATGGQPPGKLMHYTLVATTDKSGLRMNNLTVQAECQTGKKFANESFSVLVTVGDADGNDKAPIVKVAGAMNGGKGAGLKPLELALPLAGYTLGVSNAYCIGTDGSRGAGIRTPFHRVCKPARGRTTRCTIEAVFR
ncbi:MAG: hypothetical protein Q7L55_11820 [Actinomycetota bacterium]|nr:hypothetical protein [Actinomycetota bacterium]